MQIDPGLQEILSEGEDEEEVPLILRIKGRDILPGNIRIVAEFGDILTCRVRRADILSLRAHPGVLSMKAPSLIASEIEFDDPGELPPTPVLSDQRRPSEVKATGRGIVIGVVDWGLDFAHPDLRRNDGSTRILALWDQRIRTGKPSPTPYGYGVIHTSEAINAALATSDPYGTLDYSPADFDNYARGAHGTHTTSIACGNGRAGGPMGVAPESDIIFVNLATLGGVNRELSNSVALLEAVDFIARIAAERPWVVNLSMGNQAGQHDGLTLVERALDNCVTAAPGRVCVQSTGNYYNRGAHASGIVRPGERETISFGTRARLLAPYELDVWFSGRDRISCEIVAPNGSAAQATPGSHATLEFDGRRLAAVYNRLSDPNNGDNLIRIYLYEGSPNGTWRVHLCAEDVVDGRYHVWAERSREAVVRQPRFDEASVARGSTTNSICNGFRTIAVGAYDPHADGSPLAPFSSSGPTRDGRQKPDLVAPGVRILAARSAPRNLKGESTNLTRMSGTSMAAPFVSGACALMLQAAGRPLENRVIRALLLGSTRPAPQIDPQRVGSGYLDIAAAERAARDADVHGIPGPLVHQELVMMGDRSFLDSAAEEVEQSPHEALSARLQPGPSPQGSRVISWADALIGCGVRTSDSLLPALLELSGLPEVLRPFRGGASLSAANLFDGLTVKDGAVSKYLRRFFAVVASPGSAVSSSHLRAGDLLIRREANGRVRLGLLASPDIARRHDLVTYGLTTDDLRDGYYVHVADPAQGFVSGRGHAWYLAGRDGRTQFDQIVLRIRAPEVGTEWLESRAQETSPSSIFVVVDGQALIRSPPPELASSGQSIPRGSEVQIISSHTAAGKIFVEVMQHLPDDWAGPPRYWGWTAKSNIRPKRVPVTEMIAQKYDSFVHEASKVYGIPVELIRAIIATESQGDPNASSGAAWGLMQVTKGTWSETRKRSPELKDFDFDSYWMNPRVNILFGASVLKSTLGSIGISSNHPRFASLAIVAYNAGGGTVRAAISNARAAGSQDPAAECLKPEHLKPAIEKTLIYKYYLTGAGKSRNKTGTKGEAIDLKFQEVSTYPNIVQRFLDEQRRGRSDQPRERPTLVEPEARVYDRGRDAQPVGTLQKTWEEVLNEHGVGAVEGFGTER